MDMLQAPLVLGQFDGEPVQECGVRRRVAHGAEVVGPLDPELISRSTFCELTCGDRDAVEHPVHEAVRVRVVHDQGQLATLADGGPEQPGRDVGAVAGEPHGDGATILERVRGDLERPGVATDRGVVIGRHRACIVIRVGAARRREHNQCREHEEQEAACASKAHPSTDQAAVAALAIEKDIANQGLQDSYNGTINALVSAADARETGTSEHSVRVSQYALMGARALSLSKDEKQIIKNAAILHDIGKLGIPDSILNKSDALTGAEWKMKLYARLPNSALYFLIISFSIEASEGISPLGIWEK